MTPEQIELARKLVAQPWWEWSDNLCGVRVEIALALHWERGRITDVDQDGLVTLDGVETFDPDNCDTYLDLTDDATGGVLLSLLPHGRQSDGTILQREAIDTEDGWTVRVVRILEMNGLPHVHSEAAEMGTTFAEACAKALLAVRGSS